MKKLKVISLLLIVSLACACSGYSNSRGKEPKNSVNASLSENDFKATKNNDLVPQDFETAYKLGKSLLNEYYLQKSGSSKVDFSKYITNKNLLKYSDKKVLVEGQNTEIGKILIGLEKAELSHEKNCYFLLYTISVTQGENRGFSEGAKLLITNDNGKLVIADWYIPHGTVSYFDEKNRSYSTFGSPKIWDNQDFVKNIFEKAEITK
jgi:hypothetical protein